MSVKERINGHAKWAAVVVALLGIVAGGTYQHTRAVGQVRMPDADGLVYGWDPAVNFFANLNEIPEDGDATVVQTKDNTDYFSVQFADAALAGGQSLAAVKFQFMHKCPGIFGTHSWQGRLYRPGSATLYQPWTATSDNGLDSYESRGQVYEIDPWTGEPWALANLNGTQLGVWRYSGTMEFQKITQAGINMLLAQSPFAPPDAKPAKAPTGRGNRIRDDGVVAAGESRILRI